jgi:hypothetical protein
LWVNIDFCIDSNPKSILSVPALPLSETTFPLLRLENKKDKVTKRKQKKPQNLEYKRKKTVQHKQTLSDIRVLANE